jgi:hypothetical protein
MDSSLPPEGTPELIERLDRGDPTVFEPLSNRLYKRMLALARDLRCRQGLSEAECGDDDVVSGVIRALWQRGRDRNVI